MYLGNFRSVDVFLMETRYKSIILSGTPGAGKSTLAKTLSQKYGWPIYSIGKLWRTKWMEIYPEGSVRFEDFWARTTIDQNEEMDRIAKGVFENGKVIGDVRYPIYNNKTCLIILLTADVKVRAERVSARPEYIGMSIDEIVNVIMKRENDEVKMGIEMYEKDYRDYSLYHTILNSGLLTMNQEIDCIESLMKI